MQASFDGVRKRLAGSFNKIAKTTLNDEQRLEMANLRYYIGALLCMYDENGDDCHDLSEDVQLEELHND